jgi:hypothetical protein
MIARGVTPGEGLMHGDSTLLGQLAEEFTRKAWQGNPPDIEEYASRYPELASRLSKPAGPPNCWPELFRKAPRIFPNAGSRFPEDCSGSYSVP